ncbi:MAG: S41 family peptidase [Phycisphaerae bacterium]|nr:S41 family peptidase [Phycisphaerae bacterium]
MEKLIFNGMKKASAFILSLFLTTASVLAMSMPGPAPQPSRQMPPIQITDSQKVVSVRDAVSEICSGDFDSAEKILKQLDANDPNAAALRNIIQQYRKIDTDRQRSKQKAFEEQMAELAKLQARPESNEPNLPDVFSVILKARGLASDDKKKQILENEFVKKTLAKARRKADEYEANGQWLDSLINCYSWLESIYEDDKTIAEKKKALEEKMLIKALLMDNPCESFADRYQKVAPQMFLRSLDVLEYGYVEPLSYSDMTGEVFKRFEELAEVLKFADTFDGNFTIVFSKDKLPAFADGIESIKNDFISESVEMSRDRFVKMFDRILSLNTVTINLPQEVVISHFAESAFSALDPHTTLIWPKQIEDFEKSMTNEFTGIGVEISKADGVLKAVSLLPDTPAYNSGIDAGDIIEAVNGESTKDMTVGCAVSKITGPSGTKVTLTVRTPGEDKTRRIEITRAKIIVPTTRGWCRDDSGNWLYFIDDKEKVGYVRISQFSGTTAADLDRILSGLETKGMKALILDLRYNTGGYLQSAADVADLFVDKGIMVSTQPRVGLPSWEAAHKRGTHPFYPVVILINSGSASASEIVAGALADESYSRATLVGRQSYGKGSVQTVTGYPGQGAQLKYTMAYYHLPNGSRVKDRWAMEKVGRKDWGIMPNVKIELTSDELKKMFDNQRDNDVLAAANHNENKTKLIRHSLTETLESDTQLAVALLVAKTKLITSGQR